MLYPTPFPANRPRRLRASPWIRAMVAENALSPADLIWPCFVIEGSDQAEPIASMPGAERLTIDLLVEKAREAADLGIPAIAIFPNTDPALKTPGARGSVEPRESRLPRDPGGQGGGAGAWRDAGCRARSVQFRRA